MIYAVLLNLVLLQNLQNHKNDKMGKEEYHFTILFKQYLTTYLKGLLQIATVQFLAIFQRLISPLTPNSWRRTSHLQVPP